MSTSDEKPSDPGARRSQVSNLKEFSIAIYRGLWRVKPLVPVGFKVVESEVVACALSKSSRQVR